MISYKDNQRSLYCCPACNSPAMFDDPHHSGITRICMVCGRSTHFDRGGNPFIPATDAEENYNHRPRRLPSYIRSTTMTVYQHRKTNGRGEISWSVSPAKSYKIIVNYFPTYRRSQGESSWKIYSAEILPFPDMKTLTTNDINHLKTTIINTLRQVLDQEVQRNHGRWEILPWGTLADVVKRNRGE